MLGDCHYNEGAAFADKTKKKRRKEKSKHMGGYLCGNQLHMLEASFAACEDGTHIHEQCNACQ